VRAARQISEDDSGAVGATNVVAGSQAAHEVAPPVPVQRVRSDGGGAQERMALA